MSEERFVTLDRRPDGVAVIRLDRTIRTAQRKLGRKAEYPAMAPNFVPLDERLKAHFVDGGTSVH